MPRPRSDGQPPRPVRKQTLDELTVQRLPPEPKAFLVWDRKQHGLALSVQPTGQKAYKVVYSFHGRPRWYHLGVVGQIGLADARKLARKIQVRVADGYDPQAERKAERMAGTFEELAQRYLDEHARTHNKSWQQARALVERYCLPRWAKLKPTHITRGDAKALRASIKAPILANQVLASASAIFTWAIKEEIITDNPCKLVERNETRSRERVLSDRELPLFWNAFDKAGVAGTALKMILLTGQRPGEVAHMSREHIEDGWWTMPGEPDPTTDWPGTKNGATHRVWLPGPAQDLLKHVDGNNFVLRRGQLDKVMRDICVELGISSKVTPHDLRRTHGTQIAGLHFGREAMNRIQNHKEGGIGSVYDRHSYAEENKRVMETVAAHILRVAEGKALGANVVAMR